MVNGGSWVGGVAPTASDTAVFDDTFTATGSQFTGGQLEWGGLRVEGTTVTSRINLNNGGTNWVGVGAGGIDMSAAPRDLLVASFHVSDDQVWNIPSGRTLEMGLRSDNSPNNRRFDGPGNVIVTGDGLVRINGDGSDGILWQGNLTVQSGATVQMEAPEAYGLTGNGSSVTVEAGGTLINTANINVRGEAVFLAGDGDGGGAFQHTGPNAQQLFSDVTLTADASVGGTGRFDIGLNGVDPPSTVILDLAGFTLTRTGSSQTQIKGGTVSAGNLDIVSGVIGLEGGVTLAGGGMGTITVRNGGELRVYRGLNAVLSTIERDIIFEGGALFQWTGVNSAEAVDETIGAPVTLTGDAEIEIDGGAGSVLEFSNAISESGGSFGILKTSPNTLLLSNANTFTGLTDVSAGTLQVDGSLAGPASVAVGAVLGGSGSIDGLVSVAGDLYLDGTAGATGGLANSASGAVIDPAGPGVIGAIDTASLDLNNADLYFDLNGLASTDTLTIAADGAFLASGLTFVYVDEFAEWEVGDYPLIQYSGATTPPDPDPTVYLDLQTDLGHATGSLVDTGSAIVLRITAVPPSVWDGAVDANWDLATLNWQSTDGLFVTGDVAFFDDTASGTTDVNLDLLVEPGSVTLNHSTNDYTITSAAGTGDISGPLTTLVKNGTGTATIATKNSFGGGTMINDGTLFLSRSVDLGGGPIIVEDAALGTGPIEINAPGVFQVAVNASLPNIISGDGAVLKSHPTSGTYTTFAGANTYTGLTTIENGSLAIGDPTALGDVSAGTIVEDAARLAIGNPLPNGSTVSEPVTLVGGPTTALPDFHVLNSRTGIIWDATLSVEGDSILAFDAGTSIDFAAATALDYSGGGSGANVIFQGDGLAGVSGSIDLGTGSISHEGTGTLTLSAGSHSFVDTTVVEGTVALTGDGQLGSGINSAASGAFFGLEGTLNAPLTAVLTGDGTLIKTGGGVAELGVAHNLAGGTQLDDGLILVGSDGLLGTGQIFINGGSVAPADATPRTFANPVLIGDNPAFGDVSGTYPAAMTFTGDIDFAAATRTVRIYNPTTWTGTSGTAPGQGGIQVKNGLATLTVQGDANWDGILEVREGSIVIDGASLVSGDAIRVMCILNGGTSEFSVINGGSAEITNANANLRLGYGVSDPTSTNDATIAGDLILTAGGGGGKVQLGTNSASTTLNLLSGGNIFCAAVQDLDAAAATTVNLDGGTFTVIVDGANSALNGFMEGLDAVNVLDGGVFIDTNGNDARLNQGMLAGGGGTGGLTKQGAGNLTLGGANSYGGSTVVEAGTLTLLSPGTSGTGTVDVQSGAILAGDGTASGDATITGTISPGTSVGALTVAGELTFGPDSSYDWEVSDWLAFIAGTDYDTIGADSLNITATMANPVTINVADLALANFSETTTTFTLVTTASGITGFSANAFVVDGAAFAVSTGALGTWAVQQNGNDLELVYTAGVANDYDTWAGLYGLDPNTDGAPGEDPDMDGLTNEEEYAFGLDPTDPSDVNPIKAPLTKAGGTFTYTRRDPNETGLTYTTETSTDLAGWPDDLGAVENVDSDTGAPYHIQTVTVTVTPALLANPALFARVSAE
ncbi:hypothetical protein HAHE_29290 [Haloferula helveola]|uniref:Autotransporter-associated beta strand repeat-containing protein n=2 Tax=Haloferula helveola TaxID=490095 RepID=A0ABM7RHK1_9BACT|nr:hypothetical protein HAHE_29290 [Haloferula helveola]